ncbi:MAG: M23 family metallopeptidase [Clostridia bacterium]|nr:M23 family metallopeptidase [Clostridia bacterium]
MPQNNKSKSKKLKELIFGRGFYAALAACVIAAIIAVLSISYQQHQSQPIDAPLVTTTTTTKPTTAPSTTTTTTTTTTTKPSVPDEIIIDTQVPYSSFYLNPVGGKVSKFYSSELVFSQTMGDYRAHNGVDFLADVGDTVYAINKGTVTAVYEDEMLGKVVEIDHAHNVIAKYCSVSTALKVGDTVGIGQPIGTLEKIPCEALDESHVHLEIRHNGALVDPIDLMSKNGTEGEVPDEDAFVQYQPNGK